MHFTKLLSSTQIKAWDEYTIQNQPISSIDLMEKAASKCVEKILKVAKPDQNFKIFCGKGNNGGDGLAIARILAKNQHKVEVFIVSKSKNSTNDFETNLKRLNDLPSIQITEIQTVSEINVSENDIIIDAILGAGLNKPLSGLISETVQLINESEAFVIAIDSPTGFYIDLERQIETCVQSDVTYTFQIPKLRMLFPESFTYTGDLQILDIGLDKKFNCQCDSSYFYLTKESIKPILKTRKKFDHKGVYGHALLIAGSFGKMGAAVLSAKACLRSGVGLLTVAVPKSGNEIMQISVPEAMSYAFDEHEKYISLFPKIVKFKVVGIGPGMDKKPVTKNALKNLLIQTSLPMLVIDADGLNLLAELLVENPDFKIPENTILTPHVKEFDRLAGKSENSIERHFKQIEFSKKHKIFVILKGANSAITTPEGECYFNSTGNPGMATGGSGDVLTGIIIGLLAQNYTQLEACLLGVYLHGLAGDLASEIVGENALIASYIIDYMGKAFLNISTS